MFGDILNIFSNPYFWLQMSPYFLMISILELVILLVVEFVLTPKLARKIRTAKWKKLSMFWVGHDDGFMELVLGKSQPGGIIKTVGRKPRLPIFIPFPKAQVQTSPKGDNPMLKPLTPMDYLVCKRYVSEIGSPMWLMHSLKPPAINPNTLMSLELFDKNQKFSLPQMIASGKSVGKEDAEKLLKKVADGKIDVATLRKKFSDPEVKPLDFEVWLPLDPKALKSAIPGYFGIQQLLAYEKLSENIGREEEGKDWRAAAVKIGALMSGITIVCIIAMYFMSTQKAAAQLISLLLF